MMPLMRWNHFVLCINVKPYVLQGNGSGNKMEKVVPWDKVVVVASCSWSATVGEKTMGDLVEEGILTKEYESTGIVDAHNIIWTNISKDTVVVNDHETIPPGESVTWEK